MSALKLIVTMITNGLLIFYITIYRGVLINKIHWGIQNDENVSVVFVIIRRLQQIIFMT